MLDRTRTLVLRVARKYLEAGLTDYPGGLYDTVMNWIEGVWSQIQDSLGGFAFNVSAAPKVERLPQKSECRVRFTVLTFVRRMRLPPQCAHAPKTQQYLYHQAAL